MKVVKEKSIKARPQGHSSRLQKAQFGPCVLEDRESTSALGAEKMSRWITVVAAAGDMNPLTYPCRSHVQKI